MRRRLTLLLAICVAWAIPALATSYYILPTAQGAGTGADWTNAAAQPTTIVRGNTYYFGCGSYSNYTVGNYSGTTAVMTYIYAATPANAGGVAGWSSAYGVDSGCQVVFNGTATVAALFFDKDLFVVDGQTGSGKSGYGIRLVQPCPLNRYYGLLELYTTNLYTSMTFRHIEIDGTNLNQGEVNTTLGTAVTPGSATVTPASMAGIWPGSACYPVNYTVSMIIDKGQSSAETVVVDAATASTFTATFVNSHAATATVNDAGSDPGDDGFYYSGGATGGSTGITIDSNYFHDVSRNMITLNAANNVTITNNYFARNRGYGSAHSQGIQAAQNVTNVLVAAASSIGDTTLTVGFTGCTPAGSCSPNLAQLPNGSVVTINPGQSTQETATVASSAGSVITFTGALTYAHAIGELVQYFFVSSNWTINNNVWEDIEGTGIGMCLQGKCANWTFDNNLAFFTSGYPNAGQSGIGFSILAGWNHATDVASHYFSTVSNMQIHNNTVRLTNVNGASFRPTGSDGAPGASGDVSNNIFAVGSYSNTSPSATFAEEVGWVTGVTHDYNALINIGNTTAGNEAHGYWTPACSAASGPAPAGCASGANAEYPPFVSDGYSGVYNYQLTPNTTAMNCCIGKADASTTPLTDITGAYYGNPKDMGAYAYTAGYQLSVTSSGAGAGTITSSDSVINCGSACSEVVNSGTAVTLTATPTAGGFLQWTGGCTSLLPACTITVTGNILATATFYQPSTVRSNFVTSNEVWE